MVDEDLEEGVHQEDSVWQDAATVQQHGLEHSSVSADHSTPGSLTSIYILYIYIYTYIYHI